MSTDLPSPLRMRLQATLAVVVSFVVWWRWGGVFKAGLAGMFASLALVAWVAPARYVPFQRGFDTLARWTVVGFSWFILGLVYFGVFTPLRFVGRVFGSDPLKMKRREGAETFLQPLPPSRPGHFTRQY